MVRIVMSDPEVPDLSNKAVSSGPVKIHEEDGKFYVTGFGLWIPVDSEEEGRALIKDLEDLGYRICY